MSNKENKKVADKNLDYYCQQYRTSLYKYAYLRTGHDKDAAEDCVQDAFMVIYKRMCKGETFEQPKAFLYRTVDNLIKEFLRDVKKQEKIQDAISESNLTTEELFLSQIDTSTEEQIISAILSEMNDTERILYKQRYIENKNIREIAETFNISASTVTTRLYRIRKKVEESVRQQLNERGILND